MKSNNGNPCGENSARKKTGRCVHAAIVAIKVHSPDKELEQDGEMDGVECRPGGGGRVEEDGIDGDMGSASYTQQTNPLAFERNMAQLRMITALYHFPVAEPDFKEGTYGRPKIHVRGCSCTGCGRQYVQLADATVTLLAQVGVCFVRLSS